MKNFFEEELFLEQVDNPIDNFCCSGHTAPLFFRISGLEFPETPTRFFLFKSKDIKGIYCEPCLIIANYINKNKR